MGVERTVDALDRVAHDEGFVDIKVQHQPRRTGSFFARRALPDHAAAARSSLFSLGCVSVTTARRGHSLSVNGRTVQIK